MPLHEWKTFCFICPSGGHRLDNQAEAPKGRCRSWFIHVRKETWPGAIKASHGDSMCPKMRFVYSGAHFIILALGLFKLWKAGGYSVVWGARKSYWIKAPLAQITAKLVCGMWAFYVILSVAQHNQLLLWLYYSPYIRAFHPAPSAFHSQRHPWKTLLLPILLPSSLFASALSPSFLPRHLETRKNLLDFSQYHLHCQPSTANEFCGVKGVGLGVRWLKVSKSCSTTYVLCDAGKSDIGACQLLQGMVSM